MKNYWNSETGTKIRCSYCKTEHEPSYEDTYIGGENVNCYTEVTKIYQKNSENTLTSIGGEQFTLAIIAKETIDGKATAAKANEKYQMNQEEKL